MLRILVVEDEAAIRNALQTAIEEMAPGVDVQTAADAYQALDAAREHKPDLAVLDIMLPDVDGIELADRLRALCGPDLPILAISAAENVAESAYRMHAYSHLEKPFELTHFEMAVLRGLHMRQVRKARHASGG